VLRAPSVASLRCDAEGRKIGRRFCDLVSVKRAEELKNSQRRLEVLVKRDNFLCGYLTRSSVW
jgi:hypothetical protein